MGAGPVSERKRMTSEIREEAARLRSSGLSYHEIAKAVGFTGDTVKRALDPQYAARRREQINLARQFRDGGGGRLTDHVQAADRSAVKADAAARLAEIPPDTRDFTAVFMGDPIPNDPRRPWLRSKESA